MPRLTAILMAVLAACSAASETPASPPRPLVQGPVTTVVISEPPIVLPPDDVSTLLLEYVEVGGCAMMGPNCPTYRLWSDGTVEVMRTETLETDGEVEQTASIAPSIPAKIRTLALDTDFDALLPGLPAGSCQACVDGIDVSLVIHLDEGDPVVVDSLTYEIPWDHPLFALIAVAREQMGEVVELPIVSR